MDRKAEQGAAARGSDSAIARMLRHARGRLADGWIQHSYRDDTGYCAAGAISCGAEDSRLATEAYLLVCSVVGCLVLSGWNDAPGRTQDEVLAAFDKAIALAEAAQ